MYFYVRQQRQAQGLALRGLARRSRVDRSYLSRREHSNRWDFEALIAIAKALGVRLGDLWSEAPKGPCPHGQVGWICGCGWRRLWCRCGGLHTWQTTAACAVCTCPDRVPVALEQRG